MGKGKARKANKGNPARKERTENEMFWVSTEPTPDGTGYMAVIKIDEDRAITLTREQAFAYAFVVFDAAARAEYDAAVFKQLNGVGGKITVAEIGALITDLRMDRPPLDCAPMAPLSVEPGVNEKRKGFLNFSIDGELAFQMDPDEARRHVTHIFDALVGADLDAGYLVALRGIVGLEEDVARNVVGNLAQYR